MYKQTEHIAPHPPPPIPKLHIITTQFDDSGHRIPQDPAGKMRESHRILQENTGNRWNMEAVFRPEISRNWPFPDRLVGPGSTSSEIKKETIQVSIKEINLYLIFILVFWFFSFFLVFSGGAETCANRCCTCRYPLDKSLFNIYIIF